MCIRDSIQGTVVEDGEKTGGIDPHQPIRLLPAKGRLIRMAAISSTVYVRDSGRGFFAFCSMITSNFYRCQFRQKAVKWQ